MRHLKLYTDSRMSWTKSGNELRFRIFHIMAFMAIVAAYSVLIRRLQSTQVMTDFVAGLVGVSIAFATVVPAVLLAIWVTESTRR